MEQSFGTKSAELTAAARAAEAAHQERIGAIAREVDDIFQRTNLTMGEMLEVMDLLNARSNHVFSKMKITDIKLEYDRQSQ